jgi:hypothetical protein
MAKAVHIVMDHSGDSRHEFDTENSAAVKEAMERFDDLVKGRGFTAATRQEPGGTATIVRSFDPGASETLFIPRLIGG